jgi:hypothetical protein
LRIGFHDFFQTRCFGSNDPGHEFEKLTYLSKKKFYNSHYFFIELFQSHDLSRKFRRIFQVDLTLFFRLQVYHAKSCQAILFFYVIFLPRFVLLCLTSCELRYIFCPILIFFPKVILITFLFKLDPSTIVSCCFLLFFLFELKPAYSI